jgi:hypothetical protein
VVFFSAKREGIFCMGQGGVFFSEYGRDFLYGARWGKVVFFPAKMEGSFCMEQSDVFFGDYEGK